MKMICTGFIGSQVVSVQKEAGIFELATIRHDFKHSTNYRRNKSIKPFDNL